MKIKNLFFKAQKIWILLTVIIILSLLQPGVFLTLSNFTSILLSISIYGIMVFGTIFTILLGGIDLSVGAVAAASGALTVKYIVDHGSVEESVFGGILLGILLGIGVGLIHGILIAVFRVPAFLVTLASQNIVYGLAQLITNNKLINCMGPEMFTFIGGGRLWGIPVSVFIMSGIAVFSYLILNHTVYGRQIYAVGGNSDASRLSGVNSCKVKIIAYIASGFTAALAGIVLASMNRQAFAKAAQGYENDVLTAIVVGGTSLMGGEGNVSGALWGALLVGMVSNGLRLLGIETSYHGIIKGIVIIVAVSFDAYLRYRNSGLQRKKLFRKKPKSQEV